MSPRRRAPWAGLLVAAALLATAVAGAPAAGARPRDAPAPTSAEAAAPSVPPLPVPPWPVPALPVPPWPVPPLPRVPLAPVPLVPGAGASLPLPTVPLPPLPVAPPARPRPVLPGLAPLPFPRLDGRLVAAGSLPVAGGPTDTRPGPGPSFTLEARSVTLDGARLRGLATPPGRRTPPRAPAVRIDVDSATLVAPVIRARHADRGVVEARSRETARLTDRGRIDVEEITGTLAVAGLPTVPIRLAPGEVTTPGVDLGFLALPSLTLTDVTARVAFLQAGRLTIPDATFLASVPAA